MQIYAQNMELILALKTLFWKPGLLLLTNQLMTTYQYNSILKLDYYQKLWLKLPPFWNSIFKAAYLLCIVKKGNVL